MFIAISSILLFPSNSNITSIAKSSHTLLYAILQNTFAFYWYPQSYLQQGILVNVCIYFIVLSSHSALIISATWSTFHRHGTMYLLVSLPFNILVSDRLLFCVVRSTETAELPQLFHHIRRWRLAYNRQRSTHFTIHFLHISHMNWYLVWGEWRSSFNIPFAYPRLITHSDTSLSTPLSFAIFVSFIFRLPLQSSLAVVQSCGSPHPCRASRRQVEMWSEASCKNTTSSFHL